MQLIGSDIREQALVVDGDLLCRDIEVEVLIIELDFLHLRRQLAVCKQDAVTAEVAVVRAVAEVAAVRQRILAVAVLVPNGLVNEIPDEAALIERFLVRQVRVLVHAADAVAHRMRVLAADEWLIAVLREELLDGGDRRVHLALHIARAVVAAIPEDVLVVDEARRVCMTEVLAHHVEVLAAAGLVAAGPDQDGCMILVALEHGFRAVEDDILPLLMVIRQRILDDILLAVAHPAAMRLEVRLVDDVEAVAVAELVDVARVRIVRAAQCIDVVLLHHDDVLLDFRRICRAAAVTVELVAVRALEDDALAVELHDRAVHAEFTEADVLRDDLEQMALRILDGNDGTVEVRLFRAPELDALELCLKGRAQALNLLLLREKTIACLRIVELDCYLMGFAAVPLHVEVELAILTIVDGLCRDAQVIEVDGRLRVKHDLAEDAREAPEVLVLDPAARAEAEDLQGQAVRALFEVRREVEVGRRERILAVADVLAVHVDGDSRLNALQREDGVVPALRQDEVLDVRADRIVALRHLARMHDLMAVPRVRLVRVLRHAVTFHLPMGRHADGLPAAHIVVRLLKALRASGEIARVVERPDAIEAAA